MSMLIIGVNPPKSCYACSWYNKVQCPVNDGRYYYRANRHPSCPLIELPPHGRLIDADELIRELASEHVGGLEAIKKYTNADTWTSGLHTAWRLIDDASTVIEAEGET